MGKIKTVVMGDEIAEEAARQKAEAKRAQKRARQTKTDVTDKPKIEEKSKKSLKSTTSLTSKSSPGKKYLAAKALVDPKKLYSATEAIELVKKTSFSKFDGSVEVHINVTDKNLRGAVTLPHAAGKQVRVTVASDELVKKLESGGAIDFDVLVASPDMMPKLAKIAKILGPKGLMPNPKTNTISDKPEDLVKTLSGSLSWKTQPDFPIIHAVVGKVSFENKKLEENLATLLKSVGHDKIVSVYLKATMGPAIKVQI